MYEETSAHSELVTLHVKVHNSQIHLSWAILLLMMSLFTFYVFTFAIIFCRFRVIGIVHTLHLPYLALYLILPFVTLHLTLTYLMFCLTLPLTLCFALSYLTLSYILPYLTSYLTLPLTFYLTLPYLTSGVYKVSNRYNR